MKKTLLPLLLVAAVSCSTTNSTRTTLTTDKMKDTEHHHMMTEAKDNMMTNDEMTQEKNDIMKATDSVELLTYTSGNGNTLKVEILNDIASVIFGDGTKITDLNMTKSASGAIYENEEATLVTKGDTAFVEFELSKVSSKGKTKVYKTKSGKKVVVITSGKTVIVKFAENKAIAKLIKIKSITGQMYENNYATIVLNGNKAFARFTYQAK